MSRLPLALAVVLVLAVAACNTMPPTITPVPGDTGSTAGTAAPEAAAGEPVQVTMQNTQLAVGLERLAFQIADAAGVPIPNDATVAVSVARVEDVAEGQTFRQATASGNAVRFGDDLPGGGVWVVYHDFDSSGPWAADATVTFPDGRVGTGDARIEIQGRSATPRVGDVPTVVDTPKLTDGVALASLTSDAAPVEALYRQSVAEAIESGKPTVVFFGSPGSCAACATTLDEVKAVLASMGSQANFIHVESSDSAAPGQPSAAAQAWSLPPDVPWTFVIDGQGTIQGRVEGVLGRTELELLLRRVLGES
jgi:hypothetical protein